MNKLKKIYKFLFTLDLTDWVLFPLKIMWWAIIIAVIMIIIVKLIKH